MKACFLANKYLMRSFHLTWWHDGRRIKKIVGKRGFPHFSGQSETRVKVSEEESGNFFFQLVDFILATLVKFSELCFGPEKVSLFSLSMLRE